MKAAWERLSGEPALLSGAVMALINLVVLLGMFGLTTDQLAGVNTALVALLAVVIRATVAPEHGRPFHVPTVRGSRSKPAS
jgi:hypothetical protein